MRFEGSRTNTYANAVCLLTKENARQGERLVASNSPGIEAEMRNALRFAREKGMEKLGVYKEVRTYHQKHTKTKVTLQLCAASRIWIILPALKLKLVQWCLLMASMARCLM